MRLRWVGACATQLSSAGNTSCGRDESLRQRRRGDTRTALTFFYFREAQTSVREFFCTRQEPLSLLCGSEQWGGQCGWGIWGG